jgi:penicillin-binding protein 2
MAVRRAVINLSKYDVDYEDIDRYKEKYDNFAWTVALAPADDPQIAVAVMIVQGKSSLNAAPAVREIIGNYGDITGWEKLF